MDEQQDLDRQMLERLLAERSQLDVHIAFFQRRLGLPVTVTASPSPSISNTPTTDRPLVPIQRGDFFGLSRPQAAAALLRKMNKPLTTPQILEGLRESAYENIGGKNALNGLYTALSRTAEIQKVAPNTWGLKEWYPKAKEPKKRALPLPDDDVLPLDEGGG